MSRVQSFLGPIVRVERLTNLLKGGLGSTLDNGPPWVDFRVYWDDGTTINIIQFIDELDTKDPLTLAYQPDYGLARTETVVTWSVKLIELIDTFSSKNPYEKYTREIEILAKKILETGF